MKIIRTYLPDSLANYNYLLYCPQSGKTAAIDPFDAEHLVSLANQHSLSITEIWLTHEHGDHTRGLEQLKALTQATVRAPKSCRQNFAADHWLEDGEVITFGQHRISHYLTPGHTPGHGVYLYQNPAAAADDFILCGDTLFNGGVGNARSGSVEQLYQSVTRLLQLMGTSTRLYCGHDYLVNNLDFVRHYFPRCSAAGEWLSLVAEQTPQERSLPTLADELSYNPFLVPLAEWVAANSDFTALSAKQRFIELRRLRDAW